MDVVVILDPAGPTFTETGLLISFRAYTIVAGAQHVVPFTAEYTFGTTQNTKRQAFANAASAALAAYEQQQGIDLPNVRNLEIWGM